jgi:alkylation response protein AidB-like acyl-CoA dehydrogenase
MHPAVLSYWLTAPDSLRNDAQWQEQTSYMNETIRQGCWWGTLTSEPGSGGDVARTRAVAIRDAQPLAYRLSGAKHFGSGSGIMSFMVTTAIPEGEADADWFFMDVRDAEWDGSQGMQLVAKWDGHGMSATQSHAFQLEQFPASRIAWPGSLPSVAERTGGFIGCLFAGVIVGIVDEAMREAGRKLKNKEIGAYEQAEWTRCQTQHWLIEQALDGMLRAVETQPDPRMDVLRGKTAIAELSEQVLTSLCRILGGSTFSRRSPFGFWFEDVRALGFLRPPWPLAYHTLTQANE